jgi:hypothetical protein
MSKQEVIETGYRPRKHQMYLHTKLKRFNVLVCHRRFGKTVFSCNEMIDKALRCELKNPQFAYVAPNYGQAKRVAWDMFKEFTKDLPNRNVNIADLTIDIERPHKRDRIRIMLLGAENPGSLRGIYLDGCIMDEYAEMDPTAWTQVIRPALSDRLGWAIFIGTPKGQNHFYDMYENAHKAGDDWFHCVFKASKTGIVPVSELEAARASGMSQEEYDQEYECSFMAALIGAYYGKEMGEAEDKKRIGKVPFDPHLRVHTAWDLGVGDSTSIWFYQQLGQEFRMIDYIENSSVGLEWYVRELFSGERKKYIYGDHIFPHDVQARDLTTGKSREEALRQLGLRPTILPKMKLEDGINAARMLIPKCWFDREKCERGIKCLKNYERRWDAKNKLFSTKPKHNWASHGADAFRYLALGAKEEHNKMENKTFPRVAMSDYDVFGV